MPAIAHLAYAKTHGILGALGKKKHAKLKLLYIEPYVEPPYVEPPYIKPLYIELSYIEPPYIELYAELSYAEPLYALP